VTVTAESTLLKTEQSDITRNVTIRQLENLPILPVNGGGLNAASVLSTTPPTFWVAPSIARGIRPR